MLAALARALRLTTDERDHLYRISGHHAPNRTSLDAHVAPALQRVLDRLDDTPAMVLSSLAETLVQNQLAVALFGDHSRFSGMALTGIYRWFTDASERAVYPVADQPRQGRSMSTFASFAHWVPNTFGVYQTIRRPRSAPSPAGPPSS